MKYLLLGAITEDGQQLPGPDLEAWMAEIGAWYEKHGSTGKLADPGHQLDFPGKAKTIRAGSVTDGPYIEAKDIVLGFLVIEARDLAHAVDLSRGCPMLAGDGSVEVRPVAAPLY